MKCLKKCIFMRCSEIRKDLPCHCVISNKAVNLGETCPYENKTVTELNMEANSERRFFKGGNEIITWIRDKKTWKKLKTDDDVIEVLNKFAEENEGLKTDLANADTLNQIYVDFLVEKGFELSDVMGLEE